jgi:hypothetical protein
MSMTNTAKGNRFSVLLVAVLFLGSILAPLISIEATDGPRQIPVSTNIVFPERGGSDATFSVSVPPKGKVLNAQMTITGKEKIYLPVVDRTYTYGNAKNGHKAFKSTDPNKPPKIAVDKYHGTEATAVEYSAISASDDSYMSNQATPPWTWVGGNAIPAYPGHMFEFNVSDSGNWIDRINIKWEGRGVMWNMVHPMMLGADLYLWARDDTAWVPLASYSEDLTLTGGSIKDFTLNGQRDVIWTRSPGKPVWVYALVVGLWNVTCNKTMLSTDYMSLTVRSHTQTHPMDLGVDVGNDRAVEHTYPGYVNGTVTFGPKEGFVSALQKYIDTKGPSGDTAGNLRVPINFSSSCGGTITIDPPTIQVDTPPVLSTKIPTVTINSSEHKVHAVDLWTYFNDDFGKDNLTFTVNWTAIPDRVQVNVSDGHYLDVSAITPLWSENSSFRVAATDKQGQRTVSNNATVVVKAVNHLPVLDPIPDLTAYEDKAFTYQAKAQDPDGDPVTFSDNASFFDIGPKNGTISFRPTASEVGVYRINITATDVNHTSASRTVKLTVLHVNHMPSVKLYVPTNGSQVQSDKVKLVWVGSDPDGDNLTYDLYIDRGNGLALEQGGLKEAELSIGNLTNGKQYQWTVEASDGTLKSPRPSPFVFLVKFSGGNVTKQPPFTTLISPAKGEIVPTTTPTLSWNGEDPDGNAMTYNVIILDKGGKEVRNLTTTMRYMTLSEPLDNGSRYSWTVVPSDINGKGFCKSIGWHFIINATGGGVSGKVPVMKVKVSPEGGIKVGGTINYDASSSYVPNGTITLYIWTFGDGSTLTGPNYKMVSHKFDKSGVFNVSLVVISADGKTGIWGYNVRVSGKEKPPSTIFGLTADQLPILLFIIALAVALGTAGVFMAYRRVRYESYKVDEVLWIYQDGRLIKQLGTGKDAVADPSDKEVLGGMLTAVQEFVKDSLQNKKGAGSLNVLECGDHKIVIERGTRTYLATFITGNATAKLKDRMIKAVKNIEMDNWSTLDSWDGDTEGFKGVVLELDKLLK